MRRYFCDECGKETDISVVTVVSIDISLPTTLLQQYGYANKEATLDLCPKCAHKCIEKINK